MVVDAGRTLLALGVDRAVVRGGGGGGARGGRRGGEDLEALVVEALGHGAEAGGHRHRGQEALIVERRDRLNARLPTRLRELRRGRRR